MRRLATACAASFALALAPGPAAASPQGRFDEGGSTPAAREGTPLASSRAISESELRGILERELDSVGGGSGAYVFDVDARSGGFLYGDSARTSRLLASNTKLFTTAAFLDRFGAAGRLETRVFARGKRTGGRERTLKGSLALVGDGDPALATSSFAQRNNLPLTRLDPLARAVKDAGIRTVRGDIRADPTIFDSARSVPQPGISGGPFLSPLSGLSFDSGFEDGRYAQSPAKNAGRELVSELRDVGVRVTGKVRVGGLPGSLLETDPVGAVRSPATRALIDQTNTPSDNFFAEMLLKRLGGGQTKQGTTARGAARAETFARRAGSGVEMVNGSGLSRTNRASPREVAKLLIHMRRSDGLRSAFFDSLAVAGRNGTLANRMRGTAAQGRCSAKTGTIDGVSALSGYCRAGAGTVAFSILMNSVNVDAARRAQDAMTAAIARYK